MKVEMSSLGRVGISRREAIERSKLKWRSIINSENSRLSRLSCGMCLYFDDVYSDQDTNESCQLCPLFASGVCSNNMDEQRLYWKYYTEHRWYIATGLTSGLAACYARRMLGEIQKLEESWVNQIGTYTLPSVFTTDHFNRIPEVGFWKVVGCTVTSRGERISMELNKEALDELVSDARYYIDRNGPDGVSRGLVSSATAVLRAVESQGIQQGTQ